MKNATKHAEALKSLYKKMLKEGEPPPLEAVDPVRSLVQGVLSYDASDARVAEAMKVFETEFVDLNELRVATELEVQELLGQRFPQVEKRAMLVAQYLNFLFEKEHRMNLERLRTISKRDARQFLRDIPDMHPFTEAWIMLFGLGGHAIPMDEEMSDFLVREGVIEEGMPLDEVQRFVEHHIKGEEHYQFFMVLRRAAQRSDGSKKAKPARSGGKKEAGAKG